MKINDHTCGIAEIALIRVCKLIRKPSQQIVNLCWPERKCLADRDIDASAKRHSERVLSWSFVKRASTRDRLTNLLEGIGVHVAVRRAEQQMTERVESMRSNFKLRSEHVGEQVTGNYARCASRENRIYRYVEIVRGALVPLEIRHYPQVFIDVDNE